jgi:hypothetical protein
VYIPDFQAWSEFYERRLKSNPKVRFGFQTEQEVLKDSEQLNQLVSSQQRVGKSACEDSDKSGQQIVNIVSPTEQTLQQAESVMKKARTNSKYKQNINSKAKRNRSSIKANRHSKSSCARATSKKKQKSDIFSHGKLRDIFSKRK